MTTNGTALSVDKLVKRFGQREVLHGVSFRIAPGEFVALLGPNGAGKTTLFQILTGLYASDAGSVAIGGHRMDGAGDWPRASGRASASFGARPQVYLRSRTLRSMAGRSYTTGDVPTIVSHISRKNTTVIPASV